VHMFHCISHNCARMQRAHSLVWSTLVDSVSMQASVSSPNLHGGAVVDAEGLKERFQSFENLQAQALIPTVLLKRFWCFWALPLPSPPSPSPSRSRSTSPSRSPLSPPPLRWRPGKVAEGIALAGQTQPRRPCPAGKRRCCCSASPSCTAPPLRRPCCSWCPRGRFRRRRCTPRTRR
jgi:hypothetical protein